MESKEEYTSSESRFKAHPETNSTELGFEKLPFLTGVLDSPENQDLPTKLPFVLKFNQNRSLIIQKYSEEMDKTLEKTYLKGSLLSTSLGQGNFGVRRAEEIIKYLLTICKNPLSELSFLEIGCGDGYLLSRLKSLGAKKVKGCEPGPISLEGGGKFGIDIINDFYQPSLFSEKFDVIFSFGVLEHIPDPFNFIELKKESLLEKGKIFVAVPNCEQKLRLGVLNILGHEHWNYFTEQSLKNLLVTCGLVNVDSAIGINQAMIYAWGEKSSNQVDSNDKIVNQSTMIEKELFNEFKFKVKKSISLLKEKIRKLEHEGKTIGLYGGGLNVLELLNPQLEVRFFDGDIKKQGKYYLGYRKTIESPLNLLSKKVDEIWVMATDYDEEITEYLKKELKLSATPIFSYKNFLESLEVETGDEIYLLINKLFPICRSITGDGVRKSLKIIQKHIPLKIYEIPTGTQVFDWTIPNEWNINDAYILDENGEKIIDFKENNLHVLGYSIPVNKRISLVELQEHLYSLPEQPKAIPYVTSYYTKRWGFCLAHQEREKLKEGNYRVVIDSELKPGSLTYGELIIPGKSEKEIFLSTYLCHPSLANDNLSGPATTTFLAKWILSKPRKYTYRIVFIPETIGSLTYLSKNLEAMKKKVVAGFNLTCLGKETKYSFLASRYGNNLAEKVALNVLSFKCPEFLRYSFLDRGSDERQYCSPGIDLPFISIFRGKYASYPEYHTSLDNLNFITTQGLQGSYEMIKCCIKTLECNENYQVTCLGEPQLGKRDLRSTISIKSNLRNKRALPNFIAYADGTNDLIAISNKINVPVWELYPIVEKLKQEKLIV